jgi:hypothetical protein
MAAGWILGVWVVFAFLHALGSQNGQPVMTDFAHQLRSVGVEMVVQVVLVLGWSLTRDRRARQEQGQSSRRPWDPVDAEQTVVFNTPYDHAFEAALGAVQAVPGVRVAEGDPATQRITAKTGMSRASWGEHIRIDVVPLGDSQTRVAVQSRPAFAPQIVDNGRNTSNVSQFLFELRRSLPLQQAL